MKIAVITGASSGLGREFARAVLERYSQLDQVWVLARRTERLETLAAEYPAGKVRPVKMDLTCDGDYELFAELLKQEAPEIEIVINNAGFEKGGALKDTEETLLLNMIRVNVQGGTLIPRLCLPYMKQGSFLITTSSVSSFVPMKNQAVYSASKSYLLYLGRALGMELKPQGIHSLVICPGNMETEMNVRDGDHPGKVGLLPYLDIDKLTRKALEKAEKGTGVYTPGSFYKVYRFFSKLLPNRLMMKITAL